MELEDLFDKIKSIEVKDVKLYFVTRCIREGAKKKATSNEKYLYKVYQIDCNEDVRNYLYESTSGQVEKVIKMNFEMIDYDILSDDTEHLFTYPIANKVFSFSDVVTNQLLKTVPRVTSIAEITRSEELWAYCVELWDDVEKDKMFTFRKILPSKIGVDEKAKKFFRAMFNPVSQQLSLLKEETVNLDEQIDCVYYKETFYVIKKAYFEQIVGLQEEYKEKSKQIADILINSGVIKGGDKLRELIEKKPSIHKKLIKVEKAGGYKDFTPMTLNKMKRVCKKYGDKLPIDDGKIIVESEEDVDIMLKVFADYYKIGEISGKGYGTFAGRELNQKKTD